MYHFVAKITLSRMLVSPIMMLQLHVISLKETIRVLDHFAKAKRITRGLSCFSNGTDLHTLKRISSYVESLMP